MTIIVCEGKNDRIFLEETIKSKLGASNSQIKTFQEPYLLEKAINSREKASILVCEGNGFPGNARVATKMARKYWTYLTPLSLGVMGDADRGPLYTEMKKLMDSLFSTYCRIHNARPVKTPNDEEESISLTLPDKIDANIWTIVVPESLEIKIAVALAGKYPSLRQIHDADEVINQTAILLKCSKEEVVKMSVNLVQNEEWFKDFYRNLARNIGI